MVMVRDIPLYSLCEHHLIPFSGKAHVAYIPGRTAGSPGCPRSLGWWRATPRPQVQEQLTVQIADAMERTLEPAGVMVIIEAEHLCMSMRGVEKPAPPPSPRRCGAVPRERRHPPGGDAVRHRPG
jgi:GTP cyclohydrolase I